MSPANSGFLSMPAPGHLFGPGTERMARIAVRRDFVVMKQSYLAAVADLPDSTGTALRHKVRNAVEPWELWCLRAVILASLPSDHPHAREHRSKLQGELDTVFDRPGHSTR